MIAFVTLLLGLISGTYPFEVTVEGPVAAVEYQLDGAPVARLTGPPWVASVDLGPEIRPCELTARALAADGSEIGRVSQWLNLPRPPAEVEISLEKDAQGAPVTARLIWQSLKGATPVSRVTLDDQPLSVDSRGRAAFPPLDPKLPHVLTAEVLFQPGVRARKDVAFGGSFGSELSSALSAVPVRIGKGVSLPSAQSLKGWFADQGKELSVADVEAGPGKVVVVRVPTSQEVLAKLTTKNTYLPTFQPEMQLGPDDSVQLLSLSSQAFRGSGVPSELFRQSRSLTRADGGVFWYLSAFALSGEEASHQPGRRVADAVAVAGLQAAAESHRRAVVLLLDGGDADGSRYTPAAVRRYLELLRVPLFVWSLPGAKAPTAKAWGGAEDVSSIPKLSRAVARLRAELESQKIVWIEGHHLPQAVGLTTAARGVELAATPTSSSPPPRP